MKPSFSRLSIGIIGCGNIFPAYAKGCAMFHALKLKACADIIPEAALARAQEFHLTAMAVDELLGDPSIDLVINLTVPAVHAQTSIRILEHGKHLYSEKPLAVELAEGKNVCDFAEKKGLRVGCAPDTFLGAGLQTARKVMDDGWIGRPVAGTAFMMSLGPESWHPNPAFFYRRGGGPMLDMGSYYVTALVHLLGPVRYVTAVTAKAKTERVATCNECFGERLPVEVPTHNSGSLIFESGAVVGVTISFDVPFHKHSPIEIYGTEGSISIPDPNTFDGPVELWRVGQNGWMPMPLTFGYRENSRGIGVADMAHAILSGRPHRCSAFLALHVLEVMAAFEKSGDAGCRVEIENRCTQPENFPLDLTVGLLDD